MEKILIAGAEVLLDNDQAGVGPQHHFAGLKVANNLIVREVAQTPLRPDEIVCGSLWRCPLLQPNVEDMPNAALGPEATCEFRNWFDDVNTLGYEQ